MMFYYPVNKMHFFDKQEETKEEICLKDDKINCINIYSEENSPFKTLQSSVSSSKKVNFFY
jgi:hypothetical protein